MATISTDAHLITRIRAGQPALWTNPQLSANGAPPSFTIDVPGAERRLERAQPLIRALFPEMENVARPTFSRLTPVPKLASALGFSQENAGRWLLKADHQLPIAGSIKARGGFHEVIAVAERLATDAKLITPDGDLLALASPEARALFSRYSVVVGSTGNLGLSIGLISAALGFRAVVHMSSDAKEWKKQRLRDRGVEVIEHEGDYANAVAQGRSESLADPFSHFVDDEHSLDLFVGYAAAAAELALQLTEQNVAVDADHPLFVYIPCGVGGAPGGITYGLRERFGSHVHCFFAEPVASPCMMVQMIAGEAPVSVYDYGLDNRTEADGLAVGQASQLVAALMRSRLSGVYTLTDEQMFALLGRAAEAEDIQVEPSAAAGIAGPLILIGTATGRAYLAAHDLEKNMTNGTHIVWTTGGSLVPQVEMDKFLRRGHDTRLELNLDQI